MCRFFAHSAAGHGASPVRCISQDNCRGNRLKSEGRCAGQNAGNFYAGYFGEVSPEKVRAQLETNLFGPVSVTRAVLPVKRRQRSGHVNAITSRAGIATGVDFCSA